MLDVKADFTDPAHRLQHQMALARSESEGGAAATGKSQASISSDGEPARIPMVDAELVQLHVRVIALENLVVAMLAKGTDEQLDFALEMASYISPRPGFTWHSLAIGAADGISSLVARAGRFRS